MEISDILAIIFAFLGLVIGAITATILGGKMSKYLGYAESIASGFMLAVVFFDLLPHSLAIGKFSTIFIGILLGIVLILLINAISLSKLCTNHLKCAIINNKANCTLEKSKNANYAITLSKMTTVIAVALHNIPEGVALGALSSQEVIMSTALLIALHNIPEGLAMSIPLAKIGVKWWKILFFAVLTGLATVLGWGVGIYLGNIHNSVIAFILAISSGAMLQIVFGEMLCELNEKNYGITLLLGLLIGMIVAVNV